MIIPILICLLIIGTGILVVITDKGMRKQRIIIKTITSLVFVLIGIFSYLKYKNDFTYFLLLIMGAGASFLGDVFLAISSKSERNSSNTNLIIGASCFFLAQLLYSSAFISKVGYNFILLFIPLLGIIVLFLATLSKSNTLEVGKLKIPLLIYGLSVCFTCSAAMNFLIIYGIHSFISIVALGGLLFLMSDFLLIYKYFHKDYYPRTINFIYLSTYYLAQLIYMISLVWN